MGDAIAANVASMDMIRQALTGVQSNVLRLQVLPSGAQSALGALERASQALIEAHAQLERATQAMAGGTQLPLSVCRQGVGLGPAVAFFGFGSSAPTFELEPATTLELHPQLAVPAAAALRPLQPYLLPLFMQPRSVVVLDKPSVGGARPSVGFTLAALLASAALLLRGREDGRALRALFVLPPAKVAAMAPGARNLLPPSVQFVALLPQHATDRAALLPDMDPALPRIVMCDMGHLALGMVQTDHVDILVWDSSSESRDAVADLLSPRRFPRVESLFLHLPEDLADHVDFPSSTAIAARVWLEPRRINVFPCAAYEVLREAEAIVARLNGNTVVLVRDASGVHVAGATAVDTLTGLSHDVTTVFVAVQFAAVAEYRDTLRLALASRVIFAVTPEGGGTHLAEALVQESVPVPPELERYAAARPVPLAVSPPSSMRQNVV